MAVGAFITFVPFVIAPLEIKVCRSVYLDFVEVNFFFNFANEALHFNCVRFWIHVAPFLSAPHLSLFYIIFNTNTIQQKGEYTNLEKIALTPLGKEIKKRLVDLDRNQVWLIERVRQQTGLYFDGSYLHKIMSGKLDAPKVVQAIREILNIPDAPQG